MLLDHEREAMLYDVLHEFPDIKQSYKKHSKVEQALHDHEAHLANHLKLWQAVRRWLNRHKAYLVSDLPGLMLDRIQGGDFKDCQFEHLLVDEFQDLTPAEQDLFFKLRPTKGQLVALGDPRQSIYAFLGNDRLGLAKLNDHAKQAGVQVLDIPLTACQRCPQDIVVAANQLMNLVTAKPMEPVNQAHAKILVVKWSTPESEAKGMAKLIRDNIAAFPNSKHLVMVTRRQFGYWLRDELLGLDNNITVDLSFSESILETWPVREAFLFFCLLADPDAPTWRAWLGYQTPDEVNSYNAPQRNAGAYLKFLTYCNDTISAEAVLQLCSQDRMKSSATAGVAVWDRANRYRELLAKQPWANFEVKQLIGAIFDSASWPIQKPNEQISVSNDFGQLCRTASEMLDEVAVAAEEADGSKLLRQVARRLRYNIATRKPFATNEDAKLKVTTLWGAKGLTADHVYVVGLCKEAIPGLRRDSYPGTDQEYTDEQQRLFYVSITRSKGTLVLSRPEKIKRGDALNLNLHVKGNWHWSTLEMCPYLRDIMAVLPQAQQGEGLLKRNPPFSLAQL